MYGFPVGGTMMQMRTVGYAPQWVGLCLVCLCALILLASCAPMRRAQAKFERFVSPRCRILNIYPKYILPAEGRRIIVEGELLTQAPITVSCGEFRQQLVVINDNYAYFDIYFPQAGRAELTFSVVDREIRRNLPWAVETLTILDFNDGMTGMRNLVFSSDFPPDVQADVARSLAEAYLRLCEKKTGEAYGGIESLFYRLQARCNLNRDVKLVVLDLLTFYREALLLDVVEF
jgi:hypothetical protein